MTNWDMYELAEEIGRVATVRLGWPLRQGAKTDELRRMAKVLADDPDLPLLRLYEEVLLPSIERLGDGPIGRLARIEFGLTEESERLQFLYLRREMAVKELGLSGLDALDPLEGDMHQVIARDLIVRVKAKFSAPHPSKNALRSSAGVEGPLTDT